MTQKSNEQIGYVDFSNTVVDYQDGDVVMFDHVEVLSKAYPLKPKTTLIGFCSQGQITLTVNGKTLMVYINQVYKVSLDESCEKNIDLYYQLLQSKIESRRRVPSYHTMQALLRALLLDLCAELEEVNGALDDLRPSQGKMLFNRFLSMISNNEVKRQPIATYAGLLAITPKYLTMLCLKYSNKTASDWVIQYTCEDIRFYLRNSNLSVKEISSKLGFANMSHFGSYVRKHMGMSPSEFRHRK